MRQPPTAKRIVRGGPRAPATPRRKRGTHTDRYRTGTSLAGAGTDEDGGTTSRSARAGGNKWDIRAGGGVSGAGATAALATGGSSSAKRPARASNAASTRACVVREAPRQHTGPSCGADSTVATVGPWCWRGLPPPPFVACGGARALAARAAASGHLVLALVLLVLVSRAWHQWSARRDAREGIPPEARVADGSSFQRRTANHAVHRNVIVSPY